MKVQILEHDGWEALYVDGELKDIGNPLPEGQNYFHFYIGLAKEYNVLPEEIEFLDGEDYLVDEEFPLSLKHKCSECAQVYVPTPYMPANIDGFCSMDCSEVFYDKSYYRR